MLSDDLRELITKASVYGKPNAKVGSVVEKIGTSNFEVTISTSMPGWVEYSFKKINDVRRKLSTKKMKNDHSRLFKKKNVMEFPDGSGLCVVEHLGSAIIETKKRIEQKEAIAPRIKD